LDDRLAGRTALLTGATGGVGGAVARRFADCGVTKIAAADISAEALSALAAELGEAGVDVLPLTCDLAQGEECDRIVAAAAERFGRIDIGVHTAAVPNGPVPFLEVPDEVWSSEIALNLNASFFLGRALGRSMRETGGGAIVYTASIASLGAGRGMAAYTATKTGLVGLVRAMAVELAPYRIRVNAVSPGAIDTPRYRLRGMSEEQMAQLHREFKPAPLNRIATTDEIAEAFVYLASDGSSYITGHNLVVDGGTTAQVRTPAD
jgi:3-oxoacyl-[acyl-carrier protein] reductase